MISREMRARVLARFARLGSVLIVAVAMLSVGCEASESSQSKSDDQKSGESRDAKQDEAESKRIVTLGGTVTEIVFALGAGDDVVAVDKTSVYPSETEPLRKLDIFRKVSAEAVLAFEPTMLIATDGAKPDVALDRIEEAGVEVVRIDSGESIDAAKKRIRELGELLDRRERADELVSGMENDLEEAKAAAEKCESSPRTLFVYARGKGNVFVAGEGTSAGRMIELAGGDHVPKTIEGFKPLSAEAVLEVEPQVVLMTDSGLRSVGGVDGLSQMDGLSNTRAIAEEQVVSMGDLELLGFGPRTGEAVEELASKLCVDGGDEAK